MTVSPHLLVDGYNVIHRLKRFSKGDLEEKRRQLERAIEFYAQVEGMDWTICFDGREMDSADTQDPHILFSKTEGADALMERIAYQAKERQRIVCVTDDQTLRNFLFGLGASVLAVDAFEKRLKEAERVYGSR